MVLVRYQDLGARQPKTEIPRVDGLSIGPPKIEASQKLTNEEKGTKIEENFPDERLFQMTVQAPWYADIVNYLACDMMPSELTYQ